MPIIRLGTSAWIKDTAAKIATLPCVLATLNYDGLFEKSTDRREPGTWVRPDKVQKILLGDFASTILHLHGHFDEPDSATHLRQEL